MRNSAIGLATVAGLLLVLGPAEVMAGGKKKTPSPSKTLQQTYKNFLKSKSYRAKISVEGGVTQSKVHALSMKTVNDTYIGTTYGGVMEVSALRAFRTQKGGAIRKDGKWKRTSLQFPTSMPRLPTRWEFPWIRKSIRRRAVRSRWPTTDSQSRRCLEPLGSPWSDGKKRPLMRASRSATTLSKPEKRGA